MLAGGDWITPRLNGIVHYDKPPLAYWTSAAGMRLFGVNETGARFGAGLAGAFLFWCATAIAKRLSRSGEGIMTPLLLASSALVFGLTHLLATDVFLAAAVAGFYLAWLTADGRGRPWMFAALGLGFLAKGPVVLVHTLLPLLVAALWKRDRRVLAPLGWVPGWALFAVLAVPWYVMVVSRTPGLFTWLLHNQLWLRYTTTVHQRPGPPWYFAAVLVAGALPWTAAVLQGLWRSARAAGPGREAPGAERCPTHVDAALVSWALVPILFFSASGSKLPAYILPEFSVLAILAARALAASPPFSRFGTAFLLAGLAAAIELAGPRALARAVGAEFAPSLPLPALAHFAAILFAAGAIATAVRLPAVAALAACLAWYGVLGAVKGIEGSLGSPRAMAQILRQARQPHEPIVEIGTFSAAIPFYLGRTVPLVDVPRGRIFDSPGTGGAPFMKAGALPGLAQRQGRVWVVAAPGRGEHEAEALGLRYTVIARAKSRELGIFEPRGFR